MKRAPNRTWAPDASHPTEAVLLGHLDGELPPNDALRVRTHVEFCRTCRAQSEMMRQAICVFAECYQCLLPSTVGFRRGLAILELEE